MNSLYVAAVFSLVAVSCRAQKIPLHDCGSELSVINEVDVVPCTSIPCLFERNKNVTLTVNFTPNTVITDATTVVHGVFNDIPITFPLPDENACHFVSCPLSSGTPVTYKIAIFVKPEYPSTTLIVKWEVTSSSGEVFCFTVPATISG